jgi:hypothetical protein
VETVNRRIAVVMGIFDTFSKRKKKAQQSGQVDVYTYDDLPEKLRIQISHIWRSAIGRYGMRNEFYSVPASNDSWKAIHATMCKELGVFRLGSESDANPAVQCHDLLLHGDFDSALDIIELGCVVIDRGARDLSHDQCEFSRIEQSADDALEEINGRFKEHGIGYQYSNGVLIRIDSQYVHEEVVKPALTLLGERGFEGAQEEFLKAHTHYRNRELKDSIAWALKAFESTMKAICKARRWDHPANATAIPLIKTLLEHGLIPKDLESHFTGLRAAMESGLPTLSNKTARHGQGSDPVTIADHIAGYAIHIAAANIVLLVNAHAAK